jgi:hypothetical protein
MKTIVIELIKGFEIKLEYMTDNVINFHIVKNDVVKGPRAVKYLKLIFEALFEGGIKLILISLAKRPETRHIRITALRVGFKKHFEVDNNIIYYLVKGSE